MGPQVMPFILPRSRQRLAYSQEDGGKTWHLSKEEHYATRRTVEGRSWCGFELIKAVSWLDDHGSEKVAAASMSACSLHRKQQPAAAVSLLSITIAATTRSSNISSSSCSSSQQWLTAVPASVNSDRYSFSEQFQLRRWRRQ